MNISLKLNLVQAKEIKVSLELYSRLGIGQFYAIDNLRFFADNMSDYTEKEKIFEKLKSLYFPELLENQQHGINSKKVAVECKIARDLIKRLEGLTKETLNSVLFQMNKEESITILAALDLYSRIGLGQFEEIDRISYFMSKDRDYSEVREVLHRLKSVYYPELINGGYHSIFSAKCPIESKVAWDILQVLRHDISWHEKPEGGWTVNFDNPTQCSNEPLCKCKISK